MKKKQFIVIICQKYYDESESKLMGAELGQGFEIGSLTYFLKF